jgi:hypothetical protein
MNKVLYLTSAGRPGSRRWIRVCRCQGPGRHHTPAGAHARASRDADQATDAAGFLQRWLVLEPIRVTGQLTDSAVQAAVKAEYFPNQLTVIPRDGDTVTAGDAQLAWHPVDTIKYDVNLFHFAYALGKPTSNVLFWAVTVVNAPRGSPASASPSARTPPRSGGSTASESGGFWRFRSRLNR